MPVALWGIMVFGFLAGMGHALEADHLAAVAALSARPSSRRQLVFRGAWWGAGHTLALFALCGFVILAGISISSEVEAALELCVGVMIVGLGVHVLSTMKRRRIHFHAHDHGGERHIHAHSHSADHRPHEQSAHDHAHRAGNPLKALAVGLVHGAAGSGALLVLAVAATQSAATALAYVAVFGLGSILGMAALSFVVSFPLAALQRGTAWLNTATMIAIGGLALVIGGELIVESIRALGPAA
jgi:ABC-type nickel/cobalt efflux system permease component RcnA